MSTKSILLLACVSWVLLFSRVGEAASPVTIASSAPNLTELVFSMGLGSQLIARSSACDYPPEVARLPVIGDFGRPNLETLEQIKPNVFLATDLEKPGAVEQLRRMGINVLLLPCESWSQLMTAATEVGRAAGEPARATNWIGRMSLRRTMLEKRVADFYAGRIRPRVYVEVWSDPPTTVGTNTFLNDIVTLAGGRNIAANLRGRYIPISSEWVVEQNPQVIVLAHMPQAGSVSSVGRRIGWSQIEAVQKGLICTNIPPDLLLRPGPRLIDGAEALANWLMNRANDVSR